MLLRSRDVASTFYKRFKQQRNLMVQKIKNDHDITKKFLLIQRFFNRIFFIYFLCEKGLIKCERMPVSSTDLFSIQRLNDGNFLRNFNEMLMLFNNLNCRKKRIANSEFECPLLDCDLFLLSAEERELEIDFSRDEWANFFAFLNDFEWKITENGSIKPCSRQIMTPEVLGKVFEISVGEWEDKGFEQNTKEVSGNRKIRKKKGIFYTPDEITEYMCERALNFLLTRQGNEKKDIFKLLEALKYEDLVKFSEKIKKVKILDPACGSGAFLIHAGELLLKLRRMINSKLQVTQSIHEIKREIILDNLYGVDILDGAIEITKFRLWLWMIADVSINADFKSLSGINQNLLVGNSLIGCVNETFKDVNQHSSLKKLRSQLRALLDQVIELKNNERNEESSMVSWESGDGLSLISETFNILKNINEQRSGFSRRELKNLILQARKIGNDYLNDLFARHVNQHCFNNEKDLTWLKNEIIRHRPFHWNLNFGEILKEGGFDIILGNPPYIFIRGMNFKPFERDFFKNKYLKGYMPSTRGKSTQSGKINSIGLFLIRGIALLKKNHFLGYIVQNTLLRTTTNDIIRQFIMDKSFIREITDLEGGIFAGVTASTIILFLENKSAQHADLTLINYDVKDLLKHEFRSHLIPQSRFTQNIIYSFNIHATQRMHAMFEKMKARTFELREITREIIEGIVARKSDNLFIDNSKSGSAKRLLRGKNVDRYLIRWKEGQYVIFDPEKLHRARPKWVHEAPEKLITQRIGGGAYPLRVAYDDEQFYVFASTNAIIFHEPTIFNDNSYEKKYILSLLNSRLINAYYLLNFSNRSSFTVNIGKTYLEVLPMKEASPTIQQLFVSVADYLIFLHKKYPQERKLIEFFDLKLLDAMVFELYLDEDLEKELIPALLNVLEPINSKGPEMEAIAAIKRVYCKISSYDNILSRIKKIQSHELVREINDIFEKRSQKARK